MGLSLSQNEIITTVPRWSSAHLLPISNLEGGFGNASVHKNGMMYYLNLNLTEFDVHSISFTFPDTSHKLSGVIASRDG